MEKRYDIQDYPEYSGSVLTGLKNNVSHFSINSTA